ncbi:unnamed protein product [Diamesa serratosioi]
MDFNMFMKSFAIDDFKDDLVYCQKHLKYIIKFHQKLSQKLYVSGVGLNGRRINTGVKTNNHNDIKELMNHLETEMDEISSEQRCITENINQQLKNYFDCLKKQFHGITIDYNLANGFITRALSHHYSEKFSTIKPINVKPRMSEAQLKQKYDELKNVLPEINKPVCQKSLLKPKDKWSEKTNIKLTPEKEVIAVKQENIIKQNKRKSESEESAPPSKRAITHSRLNLLKALSKVKTTYSNDKEECSKFYHEKCRATIAEGGTRSDGECDMSSDNSSMDSNNLIAVEIRSESRTTSTESRNKRRNGSEESDSDLMKNFPTIPKDPPPRVCYDQEGFLGLFGLITPLFAESLKLRRSERKKRNEVDLNDHIFCCYVCYNFLHHYIILEEILTRETEIFKKQINYNSKNALANEVPHNNKKKNPADEEKCDEIVRSKSSSSVLKRNFTESNNASTAQSQSLFNMEAGYGFRNGIDSQVQPLPMTRLPFRILPIIDNIVKIEESELITNSQTSVSDPTVLDTIKTDIYLKHVSNERKNSKTSKRINDSTKKKKKYRKSTFGPKKRRTRKVIEKNCNQKLLQMLKPPLLLEEQSVLKDQETKHPQKVEINEHPIKKSRFRQAQYIKQYQVKQNEQEKNKLREEKKSRENAVISKPDKSDKKSKKNIKKSSNSEKCNIRTKKQFLQLQTNVLIHGHKKKPKQKALEEWRLKFNLSLHEIVLLERCEFPTRIVSVAPQ